MFDGWVTVRKLATPESNGWEISAPQKSPINREIYWKFLYEIYGKSMENIVFTKISVDFSANLSYSEEVWLKLYLP